MSHANSPVWKSEDGKREFAAFPVAVVGFIINDAQEFLMFRLPDDDAWQLVCGGNQDPSGLVHHIIPLHLLRFERDLKFSPTTSLYFDCSHELGCQGIDQSQA